MRPGSTGGLVADPGAKFDDGRLSISVKEGSRGSLKVSAGQVHPEDILEGVPEDLDVVHVSKGGLSDVGQPEAREDGLQPDQEGLQVNEEEEAKRWMEKRMARTKETPWRRMEAAASLWRVTIQPRKTWPKPMAFRTLSTQSMLTLS
jgi:hypothetical protein